MPVAAIRRFATAVSRRGAGSRPDADRIHDVVPGRLRRNAVAYTVAVVVVVAVGGWFVHGERAFLVVWIYTGGALALPALVVNWMVARRELGSMPGGTAWSFGLLWLYIDGLALLYLVVRPDSVLRDLTVPAVVPGMVFFAVAVLRLAWVQHSQHSIVLKVTLLGAAFVAVGGVTWAALGGRIAASDAGWLARPAALVAALLTAAALVMGLYLRTADVPTHPLNRLGLAALGFGTLTAWSILWQSLSGFTLPSAPLLALHAVTMGLLLQIPLHAPRLVSAHPSPDGGRRGVEIASREWFAEDPGERTVLPQRLRRPAMIYIAVTAPIAAFAGLFIEGRAPFLLAWVYTSAIYTTPAMVVTWAAARRTQYQATSWRLWFFGVVALYLNGAGLLLTAVLDTGVIQQLAVVAVIPCVLLFGASSILAMRARSGARTVWVDVVETAMIQLIVCFPLLLLLGEQIWRADESWITIPTAVVTVAVTTGLVWSVILHARVARADRTLGRLALVISTVACVDAWAMLAQGLRGFTLPAAPLLGLQAVTMGLLLVMPLYVPRTAPAGLGHLPPHAQVRTGRAVAGFTLAALPALFGLALAVQDRYRWSLVAFAVTMMLLLALALVRHLLGLDETRRLYRLVREAADERRRLLTEVMHSIDDDRHRVASQLHDQAIFSYVAFDSMTREAGSAASTGGALLAGVSARLRDDLAEQAESLRHLMLAVRPLEAGRARSQANRLISPIRAYVDSLYGDAPAVALRIDVDPELELDWTTETIVLRVAQEAIGNICHHAGATSLAVRLGTDGGALCLEIADDGVGFDPEAVSHESGLATMRSFAALVGGRLDIDSSPGAGATVRLWVGGTGSGGPGSDGPGSTGGGDASVSGAPRSPDGAGPGMAAARGDRPPLRLAPDPDGPGSRT